MDPRVTIIIPTHNRAVLLGQAIASALGQSFRDLELLILDDASTDATHDAVVPFFSDARVRYHRNSVNLGIARNRNRGLSLARGAYIAMLDSDDVWLDSRKLQIQVDFLDRNQGCALVGTDAVIIDTEGKRSGTIRNAGSDAGIRRTLFIKNQFVQSSVLIRKVALAEVGNYDETIPIWEDYELWLRLGVRHKLCNLQQLLTGYRDHASNVSKSAGDGSLKAYRMIYRRYGGCYPFRHLLLLKIWLKTAAFRLTRLLREPVQDRR